MNEHATLAVVVSDDSPVPEKATEAEMLRALWRHFAGRWAAVPQVTVSPNDMLPSAGLTATLYEGAEPPNDGSDRRIDTLLCRRAPNPEKSGPYETLAVEVKVTRADFLSDIKNPAKQDAWRKAATRHTYAVPAGLVQAHEVPEGSGLLWVTGASSKDWWKREVKWVKRAPYIPGHRPDLPVRVINAMVHRLAALEAATRGYYGTEEVVEGSPEELRALLKAAEKKQAELERKVELLEGRADAWRAAYGLAAGDGLPCRICGNPIRPLRPTQHWFAKWRHVDADHNEPCADLELAQRIQRAQDEYAAADTAAREERLRWAHRYKFDPEVEAEPWRAWFENFAGEIGPAADDPEPTLRDAATLRRRTRATA